MKQKVKHMSRSNLMVGEKVHYVHTTVTCYQNKQEASNC